MTDPFDMPLVETDWLEAHLEDPDLRVLDCSVVFRPPGASGDGPATGREAWEGGHIPGSTYADLAGELSDRNSELRFMMPPAEEFAAAIGRYGVGDDTRVVLYDRAGHMWATRVWWMLRAIGFNNAAVLNGGWNKWTAEGRATSTDAPAYPAATLTARPRPELFVGRDEVLASIEDDATCILNALGEQQHVEGHIPSSVNIPAASLVDPATNAYLPLEVLRERFEGVGATNGDRIITYCGGGIAASSDAFVLHMLGAENVAIYDASMSEWGADPALPMERA
jgi:thiosulfate/3-mercaptopyruvate sulfurtransferase